jgi:hypothetical protein
MMRLAAGLAMAAILVTACSQKAATPSAGASNGDSKAGATAAAGNLPFKPDFEIKDVMAHVVDAAADAMWEKQGWDYDHAGEHSLFPTTEAEWAATENHAATLAEAANALMIPGRAVDNDRWIKEATELHNLAMEEYRAIKARDQQKMFTVGSDIFLVCTDCHAIYILGEDPPKRR